jgi:hypothetical protein
MTIPHSNKKDIFCGYFFGNRGFLKEMASEPLADGDPPLEGIAEPNSLCRKQEGRTMRIPEIEIENFFGSIRFGNGA